MNRDSKSLNAHSLLKEKKEVVLTKWADLVRKKIPAARKQHTPQLRDALPLFIDLLCHALAPHTSQNVATEDNNAAKEHGEQRIDLVDYSLAEVLQEYVILRQVIIAELEESIEITKAERDIILNSVEIAMLEAGSRFAELEKTKYQLALDRVENSNRALDQVAAVAAHDLKSPLVTISGFIEVIELELGNLIDEQIAEHMLFIKSAARRMAGLVDRLLTYARLTSIPSAFERINFSLVMNDAESNLSSQIEANHAEIEYAGLPEILGDRALLAQLMQNLISNSLKYRSAADPKISVSAENVGENWVFSVKDNGLGFDSKYSEDIFGLYRRVDNTSNVAGTGIGLATCRKVIEIHGGKIWAESSEGKGAVFKFSIPKNP